jgi:hypothetical protein
MSIQFILMIAVLVAAIVVGLAFIIRRLKEGGHRRAAVETRGSPGKESFAANAWRDKFLFPLLVSIASAVVVAGVLYLLGLK